MAKRFYVQEPVGMSGSGKFCWWTIKDSDVDMGIHGNNITDYVFAGMPDAESFTLDLANRYNNGEPRPVRPQEHGWPYKEAA